MLGQQSREGGGREASAMALSEVNETAEAAGGHRLSPERHLTVLREPVAGQAVSQFHRLKKLSITMEPSHHLVNN